MGVNGFLVDLKTINPVKTENSTQADSIRQNFSLILKYRGINHIPTRVTAYVVKKIKRKLVNKFFQSVNMQRHNIAWRG